MRISMLLVMLCSGFAFGQLTETEKKATLKYIVSLQDATTGAFKVDAAAKPSLRATAGAMRSIKQLIPGNIIENLPNAGKTLVFVHGCQESKTGAYSEPHGKPDVTITSIGMMAKATYVVSQEDHGNAPFYLRDHAKSFEDVRIAAAGMSAAGFRKEDFMEEWIKIADKQLNNDGTAGKGDGKARETASVAAMKLRLGYPVANKAKVIETIVNGQRADGGWGKADVKASDLETTYRVMRALMLLKEKPKDSKALNAWLAKHRNADGGYAMEPGNASSMSAVYYATAIYSFMEK